MCSDEPPKIEGVIVDVNANVGKYSCPICFEFESDSVRSVQGHISGSKDETHRDLGWNFEDEIRATGESP